MSPSMSYMVLLAVQALHLLHHRLSRRHISFAEVVTAVVLCVPPTTGLVPGRMFVTVHLALVLVQMIGSLWIKKLSPDWGHAEAQREARGPR